MWAFAFLILLVPPALALLTLIAWVAGISSWID